MFAPYCARHGSRVLLTTRNITALVATENGLQAHYRCSCGLRGVWDPSTPLEPAA